jgi:hypothetical protein
MIYSFCKFKNSANLKRFTLVLFIFLFTIIGSNCQAIYETGFVPIPDQPISDEVEIGSEWVELTPPKPLIPYKSLQEIVLRFDNISKESFSDDPSGKVLNLADGRLTRIDAILFDEKGEPYELRIAGTGGVGGGIAFARKNKIEVKNENNESSFHDFPTDRIYTKLQIRSEIPIQINKIEWVCYNNK